MDVSRQGKDIIMKQISAAFRNTTLEFYGIKSAKIKELVNVEFPVVEVRVEAADFVFLLEDDTYLHLEFQSAYNAGDLPRFAVYDWRLYQRDKRSIRTVVIYVNEAVTADLRLNIGSADYSADVVNMVDYDGDMMYNELAGKVNAGKQLDDFELVQLIMLPLMRVSVNRGDAALDAVKLTESIADKSRREMCIGSIVGLARSFLDDSHTNKLKEVLGMINVVEEIVMDKLADRAKAVAKKMLRKDKYTLEEIIEITELDIETVIKLRDEMK